MPTETISIVVDTDSARVFGQVPPSERKKLELLLRLRLRKLTSGNGRPLVEIVDEIGAEAEARGLMPEMVALMLGEPQGDLSLVSLGH